jgi:hypothetical protein
MIITFGFGSVEIGTDGSTVVDLPGIGVNVGGGGTNISFGDSVIDISDAGTVIDIPLLPKLLEPTPRIMILSVVVCPSHPIAAKSFSLEALSPTDLVPWRSTSPDFLAVCFRNRKLNSTT